MRALSVIARSLAVVLFAFAGFDMVSGQYASAAINAVVGIAAMVMAVFPPPLDPPSVRPTDKHYTVKR